EIDINLIAGNDRLLLPGDLIGELLAQAFHQFWNLYTEESIIKRIAQICLREAGRNHQRNSFGLQTGHSLLSARSRSEVESADDYISRLRARRELRVIVLHRNLGHHLARHVVAVSVILAINR